jgi:predicted GH43/DUF377 family glycosyl hydrolase
VSSLLCAPARYDDENLYLMLSDDLYFWSNPQLLLRPAQPWELVKIGNCGSPIETDAGWLVLTYGVGPMRKYCISTMLLDLQSHLKVIGRLNEPLLEPTVDQTGRLRTQRRIHLRDISPRWSIGSALWPK